MQRRQREGLRVRSWLWRWTLLVGSAKRLNVSCLVVALVDTVLTLEDTLSVMEHRENTCTTSLEPKTTSRSEGSWSRKGRSLSSLGRSPGTGTRSQARRFHTDRPARDRPSRYRSGIPDRLASGTGLSRHPDGQGRQVPGCAICRPPELGGRRKQGKRSPGPDLASSRVPIVGIPDYIGGASGPKGTGA